MTLSRLPGVLSAIAVFVLTVATAAAESVVPGFDTTVSLEATGAGSFTVRASLGDTQGDFLLDTGASLVTITPALFAELRKAGGVEPAGKVAARDAAGRLETLQLYRVESFTIGSDCRLGPVDVAVLKGGSRNLLGMSALRQAAPFAVAMAPPALALSRCGDAPGLAAR